MKDKKYADVNINEAKELDKEEKKLGFFKQFYHSTFGIKDSEKLMNEKTGHGLYAFIILQIMVILICIAVWYGFASPFFSSVDKLLNNENAPEIKFEKGKFVTSENERILDYNDHTKFVFDTNLADPKVAIAKYIKGLELKEDKLQSISEPKDENAEDKKEESKVESETENAENASKTENASNDESKDDIKAITYYPESKKIELNSDTTAVNFLISTGLYSFKNNSLLEYNLPAYMAEEEAAALEQASIKIDNTYMSQVKIGFVISMYIIAIILFFIIYRIVLKTIGIVTLKMLVSMNRQNLTDKEISKITTYGATIPLTVLTLYIIISLFSAGAIINGNLIYILLLIAYIVIINYMAHKFKKS